MGENRAYTDDLYKKLRGAGYNIASLGDNEDAFYAKMGDPEYRRKLYDWVSRAGHTERFNLGSYNEYYERFKGMGKEVSGMQKGYEASHPKTENVQQKQVETQPVQSQQEVQPQQPQQEVQEKPVEEPQQASAPKDVSPKDDKDNKGFWGRMIEDVSNAFTKSKKEEKKEGIEDKSDVYKKLGWEDRWKKGDFSGEEEQALEEQRRNNPEASDYTDAEILRAYYNEKHKNRTKDELYNAAKGTRVEGAAEEKEAKEEEKGKESAPEVGVSLEKMNDISVGMQRVQEEERQAWKDRYIGEDGKLHPFGRPLKFGEKRDLIGESASKYRREQMLKQYEAEQAALEPSMQKGIEEYKSLPGGNDAPKPIEKDGKKVWLTSAGITVENEEVAQGINDEYNRYQKELDAQISTVGEQADAQEAAIMPLYEANKEHIDELRYRRQVKWGPAGDLSPKELGELESNSEGQMYDLALRHLRNVRKIEGEGEKREEGKGKAKSFFSGVGSRIEEKIEDLFGPVRGGSAAEAIYISGVAEKMRKGEKLTSGEQAFLDAYSLEMVTRALYNDKLGAYNMGGSIVDVAEFLIEMGIGGELTSAGKAGARKMANYAVRKYAPRLIERYSPEVARRMLTTGSVLTRGVLDAANSYLVANTLFAQDTFANILNRHSGGVEYNIEQPNVNSPYIQDTGDGKKLGKVTYGGQGFGKEWGEAIAKGETSEALNIMMMYNAEYLQGVGGALMKGAGKVVSKWMPDELLAAIEKWGASPAVQGLEKYAQKMHWQGAPSMYASMIETNAINALLVGDYTLDKDPETGVFNRDRLLQDAIMFGIIEGVSGVGKTLGFGWDSYQISKQLKEARLGAGKAWQGREAQLNNFYDTLDRGTPDEVLAELKEMLAAGDLTRDQLGSVLTLARLKMNQRGMAQTYNNFMRTSNDEELRAEQMVNEGMLSGMRLATDMSGRVADDGLIHPAMTKDGELVSILTEEGGKVTVVDMNGDMREMSADAIGRRYAAYSEKGASENSADAIRDAYYRYNYHRAEVMAVGGGGEAGEALLRLLDEDPATALSRARFAGNETARQVCMDYLRAKSEVQGIVNGRWGETMDAIDAAEQAIDAITDKSDGMVHSATLKNGEKVYVISSDGNTAVVSDEQGRTRMVETSDIASEDGAQDARKLKRESRDDLLKTATAEQQALFQGELSFEPGEEVVMLGKDGTTVKRVRVLGPTYDAEGQPEDFAVMVENEDGTIEPINKQYLQQQANRAYMNGIAGEVSEARLAELRENEYGWNVVRPGGPRGETRVGIEGEIGGEGPEGGEGPTGGGGVDEGATGGTPVEHEVGERVVFNDEHGEPIEGEIVRYDEENGVWIVRDDTGEEWDVPGDEMSPTGTQVVGGEEEPEAQERKVGDRVRMLDDEGNIVEGVIQSVEGDSYIVRTDTPIDGDMVRPYSAEELDVAEKQVQEAEANESAGEGEQGGETQSALAQIPVDEGGNPDIEQAQSPAQAVDALVEMAQGSVEDARETAELSLSQAQDALKKIQKVKAKAGASVAETMANVKAQKEAVAEAERKVKTWQDIVDEMKRREEEPEVEPEAEETPVEEEPEGEETPAEEEVAIEEPVEEPVVEEELEEQEPETAEVPEASEAMKRVQELVGKKLLTVNGAEIEVRGIDKDGNVELLANGSLTVLKPEELMDIVDKGRWKLAEESAQGAIEAAESEVETAPTPGQIEAGNYKKGHVKVAGYEVTIENPKGSVRRGVDAEGKPWETKMANTYGYIRGTEGVDGDHIDVFLANDMDAWDGKHVYVVDQYNPDGTFDEHKVMLGFGNAPEAKKAYLANYSEGWEDGRRIDVSEVEKGEFDKWIESSHRKTKPFTEYKGVEKLTLEGESGGNTLAEKDAQLAELQERLNLERERVVEYYLSTPKAEKLNRLRDNLKGSSMNVVSNINQQYPGLIPSDVSQEAWRSENCSYLLRDLLDGKYGELPEGAKGNLERALNTLEGIEKEIDALVKEGERKRAKEIKKLQEAIADRRFELESGPQPAYYEEGMDVYMFDESGEPVRYMVEKVDGDKITISRFEEDEEDDNAEPVVVTKAQLDEVYDSAREAWEKKDEENGGQGAMADAESEVRDRDVKLLEGLKDQRLSNRDGDILKINKVENGKVSYKLNGKDAEIGVLELASAVSDGIWKPEGEMDREIVGEVVGKVLYDAQGRSLAVEKIDAEGNVYYSLEGKKGTRKLDEFSSLLYNNTWFLPATEEEAKKNKAYLEEREGSLFANGRGNTLRLVKIGTNNSWVETTNNGGNKMRNEYLVRLLNNGDWKRVNEQTIKPAGEEQTKAAGKGYSVEPAQYETKRGKTLDMQLLKFDDELSAEEVRRLGTEARKLKGWYDRAQGGFMMRSKEDAEALAKNHEEGKSGPSLSEVQAANGGKSGAVPVHKIDVEGLFGDLNTKGQTKLSDHATPVNEAARKQDEAKKEEGAKGGTKKEEKQEQTKEQTKEEPKNEGQFGFVSDEKMEELKRRLREKLRGRLNTGFDPEILSIGMELAAGYLDRGIKAFSDFARKMIEDLGDAVRPYLKAFYNGARDLPEVIDSGLAAQMTPYDEVSRFDIANLGRSSVGPLATAEHVVAEQEAGARAQQYEALLPNIRKYGFTGEVQLKDGRKGTVIIVDRDGELDAVTGYKMSIDGKLVDVSPNEIDVYKTIEGQPELLEDYGTGNGEYGEQEAEHDTAAVVREAETVAVAAESLIENAGTEEELNVVDEALQQQIDKVNDMLEVLDHYDVDPDSPEHEAYGKMKSAEKKAVKDANRLAKRIISDLGVPQSVLDGAKDGKGKKRKLATSNFAPIGGNVDVEVPLEGPLYLRVSFDFDNLGFDGDIGLRGAMLRVEGGEYGYTGTSNCFLDTTGLTIYETKAPTYRNLLEEAKGAIKEVILARGRRGEDVSQLEGYVQNIDRLLKGKREQAKPAAVKKEAERPAEKKNWTKDRIYGGQIYEPTQVEGDVETRAQMVANTIAKTFNGEAESATYEPAKGPGDLAKAIVVVNLPSDGRRVTLTTLFQKRDGFGVMLSTTMSIRGDGGKSITKDYLGDLNIGRVLSDVFSVLPKVQKPDKGTTQKKDGNVAKTKKETEGASEQIVKPSYYMKVGLQTPVMQMKKDMDALVGRLVDDLGQVKYAGPRSVVQHYYKSSGAAADEVVATINIGNAGGGNVFNITMRLGDNEGGGVDTGIKFSTTGGVVDVVKGGLRKVQMEIPADITYDELLKAMRREAAQWFPEYMEKEKGGKVLQEGGKEVTSQVENDVDAPLEAAFSGTEEELNEGGNGNGLQRPGTILPVRDSDGAEQQGGLQEGQGGSGEEVQQEGGRPHGEGMAGSTGQNRPMRTGPSDAVKNSNNYFLGRERRDVEPKDVNARIEANIAAIELSQELANSGKRATAKQKDILAKFSGWGGLGKAFTPNSFPYNPYPDRLKKLLGDDAYKEAEMSRNTGFYTSKPYVDAMWDIVKLLGVKGGAMLETSAGKGSVLARMPEDLRRRANITAIELDGTTGQILSQLHPDANVLIQGFEKTPIANGSVQCIVSNVPFGDIRVFDETGDNDLAKKFPKIHDFFIAKATRKLCPGGIGVFITTSGTLDNSQTLRDWVVSDGEADFIGAFRLNNKTFGGTEVTSDIIVIRKRVDGKKSAHAIDVSGLKATRTERIDTGKTRKLKNGKIEKIYQDLTMEYNKYFVEHPEYMGGEMIFAYEEGNKYRPYTKTLRGNTKTQEERLSEWVKTFAEKADESDEAARQRAHENFDNVYEKLGEGAKEGGMLKNSNGELCVVRLGYAVPLELNANKIKGKYTREECFDDYVKIKDALADVLRYETENEGDEGLAPLLKKLDDAYENFVGKYRSESTGAGLQKNPSLSFLRNDIDYSSISALETSVEYRDEEGKRKYRTGKSDVFTKRVVQKELDPKPKTIKDGVIASVYKDGRIDADKIGKQLGRSADDIRTEVLESGLGYENPATGNIDVNFQYLSGNVKEKLEQARANNEGGRYDRNIKALEELIAEKLPTIPKHLIDTPLGASWLDKQLYVDFIKEQTGVGVKVDNLGGTWQVAVLSGVGDEKNKALSVKSDVCEKIIWGHELITAAMQMKTIEVKKTYTEKNSFGSHTVTLKDPEATQACAARIEEIRDEFKRWVRERLNSDMELGARVEKAFNDLYNNFVALKIPDMFVPKYFTGATHALTLREHQAKAAIRSTMQNLMLAHEVGSGKTFTLITSAMEMRRIGTSRKPMIVVQNSTVGQFVNSAKFLYPNARILSMNDSEMNLAGRQAFYAKIKYNDWDMIIVPQSVLDMIPDSQERRLAYINSMIEEHLHVIELMEKAGMSEEEIKDAYKEVEKYEQMMYGVVEGGKKKEEEDELRPLFIKDELDFEGASTPTSKPKPGGKDQVKSEHNAQVRAQQKLERRVDPVADFDDMGIDAILVDEAHYYKHLGFATMMQRGVKGVDSSFSKKAQSLYLKTRSVMERTGGKGVVFATGTPITNTAAELWTFMRYLYPADTLKAYDIYYFDDFVRNFGNVTQVLEFTTSGQFKENNRFAGYGNVPELVRIWSGVSDTVLSEDVADLSKSLPVMDNGNGENKPQDIYLDQSQSFRALMKSIRKRLKEFENMAPAKKKKNRHIPLVCYGTAKKGAIDVRLVARGMDDVDQPNSKTNAAVRETLADLRATDSYKGTVAIFADNYRRLAPADDTGADIEREGGKKKKVKRTEEWNLFDEIKRQLVEAGVPESQIVIMRPGMTDTRKTRIFDAVNAGDVRVIMGSTATLGTGVNIQERLHMLIHMDAPNRPSDYEQRNGRILRQGNLHKEWGIPVRILRFGLEDSLDVTAYQRLATKSAFIHQIMNGKVLLENPMENRSLVDENEEFNDVVAELSGCQSAMLKNEAERRVRRLDAEYRQWEDDQNYIKARKPVIAEENRESEYVVSQCDDALSRLSEVKGREIVADGTKFKDIAAMADYFKEFNKRGKELEDYLRKYSADGRSQSAKISIGGIEFNLKAVYTSSFERGNGGMMERRVHRAIVYNCPELHIGERTLRGAYLKGTVEHLMNDVMSGDMMRETRERNLRRIEGRKEELSKLSEREGRPFEKAAELEEWRQRLDEYTEAMQNEMAEKEKKYAAEDSQVNELGDIDFSSVDSDGDDSEEGGVDEKMYRDGAEEKVTSGVEEEVTSAEEAERKAEETEELHTAMRDRVEGMMKELHLGGAVDIRENADGLKGRMARSKGWYDPQTGRMTIILSNNADMADVEATVFHEATAHKGLRVMLGDKFDAWLDRVYKNANKSIRKQINEIARKNGWDFRKATDEYLGSLSEDGKFLEAINNGTWQRIRYGLSDMLRQAGFNIDIGDDELRYALWRSHQNLKEGPRSSILAQATDVAMQSKLQVGNFAPQEGRLRFRDRKETAAREQRELTQIRERMERREAGGWYQSIEAFQDSMQSLFDFYRAVRQAQGKKWKGIESVRGFENAYMGENRLSSVVKNAVDDIDREYFEPLYSEIRRLAGNKSEEQRLFDYMLAKHGRERNEYMAERNAMRAYEKKRKSSGKEMPDWESLSEAERESKIAKYRKDYAGLTSLFPVEEGEEEKSYDELMGRARMMVDEYEAEHDTGELWDMVNRANDAILRYERDCGMISPETYEKISNMYEYYIPLRGFAETTSDEVYAYINGRNTSYNSPMKTAKGRKSRADNPLMNMEQMAATSIMEGEKNRLVKQPFYNFVQNNPTDYVSTSELWLRYNETNGTWETVFPDLEGAEGAQVQERLKAFEDRMEELSAENPDMYRKASESPDIPYRVVGADTMREHQVIVRVNGKDVVLTVNGNPRLAQALNGKTNPDSPKGGVVQGMIRTAGNVNRYLSMIYTTYNPDFIVGNFARDAVYANWMAHMKESPLYAVRYNANFVRSCKNILKMVDRRRRGKLDMSDDMERMFDEFMRNGGETGYIRMYDAEEARARLEKWIRHKVSDKTWRLYNKIYEVANELNRAVEMSGRFAAYMTSRNSGRDIARSIWDAKEITVNFNKKGAGDKFFGAKGQTKLGNVAAASSGYGRTFRLFFNVHLQGPMNMYRQAARHPLKFALGMMTPLLVGGFLSAYLRKDDDEYWDLPDFTRRQNVATRIGKTTWLRWPLSHEQRPIWAIGEAMGSCARGKEDKAEMAGDVAEAVFNEWPIDIVDSQNEETKSDWLKFALVALTPSFIQPFVEARDNRSWTGQPIYKDTPFNKDMPEWTKAYKNTDKKLVAAARWLNEISGGNAKKKGAIDINPATVEYVLNSTVPLSTFFTQFSNIVDVARGEKDFDWRYVPLLNRFLMTKDEERNEDRGVTGRYMNLQKECAPTLALYNRYDKALERGEDDEDYGTLLAEMEGSEEYGRMEIWRLYAADIKKCYDDSKDIGLEEDERNEAHKDMVELEKECLKWVERYRESGDLEGVLNEIREEWQRRNEEQMREMMSGRSSSPGR